MNTIYQRKISGRKDIKSWKARRTTDSQSITPTESNLLQQIHHIIDGANWTKNKGYINEAAAPDKAMQRQLIFRTNQLRSNLHINEFC